MSSPARTPSPIFPSDVIASSTGRNLPGLQAVERRHREAVLLELLPVELGLLLVPRPHHCAACRVDPIRELHALVEADTRKNRRERERDAVERVVVVVED